MYPSTSRFRSLLYSAGIILFFLSFILIPDGANAATYVVTNTNDAGPGSLRQAIIDANGNIGTDDIAFNISGAGVHTIAPLTDLPWVSGPTNIDGWTQGGPGYTGPPLIEVTGASVSGAGNHDGIDIRARDCLIRGLILNEWSYQIHLFGDDNTGVANAGRCQIQGNYIGLDATGTTVPGTGGSAGIAVYWSDNNIIGGTASALRNIITGNYYEIWINGANASGNVIQGNYIGTDVTGMNDPYPLGGNSNIYIWDGSNNHIGGNGFAGEYNIISASYTYGVYITGSQAMYNRIQGNVIGLDVMATGDLGNGVAGIYFTGDASHSIVGGIGTGEMNIIARNGYNSGSLRGAGVKIDDGCTSIAVSANSIYENGIYGELGIDLNDDGTTPNDDLDPDSGANDLQNFPVLTSFSTAAGSTYVRGTLNSESSSLYALEFFSNEWPDPAGYGEGETFLGIDVVTTDINGNATFDFGFPTVVPDDYCITATATAIDSCTSEFSHTAYLVDFVVDGIDIAGELIMSWNKVPGTHEYWIYGAANDPYFEPEVSSPYTHRLAVVPGMTATWGSTNGIGDDANNWTYVIVAVNSGAFELARSNYFGEFDYDLP